MGCSKLIYIGSIIFDVKKLRLVKDDGSEMVSAFWVKLKALINKYKQSLENVYKYRVKIN